MSKQHSYDFNSVEEIISCAAKTGLSLDDMTSRLGVTSVEYIKWQIECRDYGRRSLDDSSEPPTLEVSQERLDSLAEYCRVQGIFPIITKPENVEPVDGRNNPFKEQMIISWNKFLKREFRHPTSNELINQLEEDAVPLSGIAVDRKLQIIKINRHSREYGNSSKAFEQTYRRLKDQMLDQ